MPLTLQARDAATTYTCPLTLRQLEVLRVCAEVGQSNLRTLAKALKVSENTVLFHLKRINVRLGTDSRGDAVVVALRNRWIALPHPVAPSGAPPTRLAVAQWSVKQPRLRRGRTSNLGRNGVHLSLPRRRQQPRKKGNEIRMSATKTFDKVTQSQWTCVQNTSAREHGTVYIPSAPSNQGKAVTKITFIGEVDTTYDYDPAQQTVTYTITKKPGIVSDDQIWNGISQSLQGCSTSQSMT